MVYDFVSLSPRFKLASLSWSLTILGLLLYVYLTEAHDPWFYLMLAQQSLSWLLILSYLLLSLLSWHTPGMLKLLKYAFLLVSGPYLLSASIYGFVAGDLLSIGLYLASFIAWWLLFTVAIYCTFILTLEVALLHHRKKKARYYASFESVSAPLIK